MIKRLILAVFGIALFGAYIAFNPAFHQTSMHLGKERFYTYVDNVAHRFHKKSHVYEYHLMAINTNGTQKLLTLKVDHELHPRSYLRLYIDRDSKVTDWEEIRRETLPSKLTEQLRQL
jgi:uncharacterized protein (TIGR01655 family)